MGLIVDPCLTSDEHQLRDLMSNISETCSFAAWAGDTEFEAWRLATEGGTWGHCSADEIEAELIEAIALAKDLGVWLVWSDRSGCDNEPVPLSDWQRHYATWRAGRTTRHVDEPLESE